MKSIAKNSAFNIIYTSVNLLFPLLTSVYIGRVLLEAGVGKVAYAQNIVSYFITASILGLPTYGTREIAKSRDKKEECNRIFSELYIINSFTTTISIILYIVLVIVINIAEVETPLAIACGLLLVFNYINIDWLYQGQEEYEYIAVRSIIIKILSFLSLIVFCKKTEDYVVYAIIVSFGTGANYLFNIIHSRKYVHLSIRGVQLSRHWRPLIYMGVSILMVSLYSKVDITMLGYTCTDSVVGYYSIAARMIYFVTTACCAITAVLLPRLSYLYKNNQDEFSKMLDLGIKSLCYFSIPAAGGVFILAKQIIVAMYGKQFEPAHVTMMVLVPMIIIKSFGDLLGYQMIICTENEKKAIIPYVVGASVNIVLNSFLIPIIAQDGAAIASVASEIVVVSAQIIWMKTIVKYKFSWYSLGESIATTIIMCIGVYFTTLTHMSLPLKVLASVIIGTLIYVVLNQLTKNEMQRMILEKIKNRIWKF